MPLSEPAFVEPPARGCIGFPYDGLQESTRAFLDWRKQHGVTWARTADGRWLARSRVT
jgi:hypothetical protein